MSRSAAFSTTGAAYLILTCYMLFAGLNMLYPVQGWEALLFLLPGVISLYLLLNTGLSREECYVKWQPISILGLLLLILPALGLLAILSWHRPQFAWNWQMALFNVPVSAIAQELFFRAALLVTLLRIFKLPPVFAIFIQAVLFAAWHLPEFFHLRNPADAGWYSALLILLGISWGVQVIRDRSIVYAIIMHIILLLPIRLITMH